jgi:methylated-DNA-[protein]-cysteine S-methyltransferase
VPGCEINTELREALHRAPKTTETRSGHPITAGRHQVARHPNVHNVLEDAMLHYTTMYTPTGPLTAVVSAAGAVRSCGFTDDVEDLLPLIHPSLLDEAQPTADIGSVGAAIRSYFDGELDALDSVPVEQRTSGRFIAHAWGVMRDIKPGVPVTYTQFAGLSGRPAAIRAAAMACARNPVALFTPCHRVLRADGSLGGYRWGLTVKAFLLDHERR